MNETKKKAIICFYKGNINEDIHILEELDSKGFEVHLFNDVNEGNLKCDVILNIIKELYGVKSNEYDIYVVSNIKEFIMLQYILYNNLISGALYLNNNPEHMKLDNLYKEILDKEICTNASNFYLLKDEENIFDDYCIFDGDFRFNQDKDEIQNKVYIYSGINYVFSINNHKSNKKVEIIELDSSENMGEYRYCLDVEYVDDYLDLIESYSNSTEKFLKSYKMIYSELDKFKAEVLKLPYFEKELVRFKLDNNLYHKASSDRYKIFLSSVLLTIFNDKEYLEFLLQLLIESNEIDKYNRFFAYYQCVRYNFIMKDISDDNINHMIEVLYEKIYDEFSILSEEYTLVPKKQRNNDMIFIFVSQCLTMNHAPTKIAFDVCYNFIKNLNKKIVLISTKEVATLKGLIPMSNIVNHKELKEYIDVDAIRYKDIQIPFYQPDVLMPNESEIINILNMLKKYKPGLIINIGTTLIGDLCTKVIPTVTIPLGSDECSKSTFHIVNDKNGYEKYIKKHSRNSETLIISKFQFELKPQQYIFTKEQLGIPENKFIIGVVGNRLNQEIDDGFLEVLEKNCELNNSYILFINKFNFDEEQIIKYPNLIKNYRNMGYHDDLLAILDNIDLYANPKRNGGGTSAIYAMYLGKPVVTLNYGDVANNAGEQFVVENYDLMSDKIFEYKNEKEFYNNQSILAKKIALEMVDSSRFVKELYHKVVTNPLY